MTRLIFVYNANSGSINALLDGMNKIVSPKTYSCNLCSLTFGNFSEKEDWKKFRETSEIQMEFYHKDEFLKAFKSKWLPKYDLPIILSEERNELQIFLNAEELNTINNVSELIDLIEKGQSV